MTAFDKFTSAIGMAFWSFFLVFKGLFDRI